MSQIHRRPSTNIVKYRGLMSHTDDNNNKKTTTIIKEENPNHSIINYAEEHMTKTSNNITGIVPTEQLLITKEQSLL